MIGRPVVKSTKEAKAAAAAGGGRQRTATTASGMPIIGRPVVSPAVPSSKAAKAPGLGDSPQAANQLQQQQQNPGPTPAGQQQQSTMAAAARMGGAGAQSPAQAMQVRQRVPKHTRLGFCLLFQEASSQRAATRGGVGGVGGKFQDWLNGYLFLMLGGFLSRRFEKGSSTCCFAWKRSRPDPVARATGRRILTLSPWRSWISLFQTRVTGRSETAANCLRMFRAHSVFRSQSVFTHPERQGCRSISMRGTLRVV